MFNIVVDSCSLRWDTKLLRPLRYRHLQPKLPQDVRGSGPWPKPGRKGEGEGGGTKWNKRTRMELWQTEALTTTLIKIMPITPELKKVFVASTHRYKGSKGTFRSLRGFAQSLVPTVPLCTRCHALSTRNQSHKTCKEDT